MAVVVQEGIQKVFSSFVEGLRREAMRAADGHASARSVRMHVMWCYCIMHVIRETSVFYSLFLWY